MYHFCTRGLNLQVKKTIELNAIFSKSFHQLINPRSLISLTFKLRPFKMIKTWYIHTFIFPLLLKQMKFGYFTSTLSFHTWQICLSMYPLHRVSSCTSCFTSSWTYSVGLGCDGSIGLGGKKQNKTLNILKIFVLRVMDFFFLLEIFIKVKCVSRKVTSYLLQNKTLLSFFFFNSPNLVLVRCLTQPNLLVCCRQEWSHFIVWSCPLSTDSTELMTFYRYFLRLQVQLITF